MSSDKPESKPAIDVIKTKDAASKYVVFGKDLVALLRDLALFILALLLLVFPGTFNNVLSSAGFEEGSFVGFKWKPKLLDSDKALKESQSLITDLKEQNNKMSQALGEAQSKLNDPSLKQQLADLEERNKQLNVTSTRVEKSVASTIESNAALVEKVQSNAAADSKWGVVYGGDTKLDAAKYEVGTIAQKSGIPNASIYLRQGSYRSVSVVGSKAEADQVLPKARQRQSGAYIVDMTTWCPNSVAKDGYRECTSP